MRTDGQADMAIPTLRLMLIINTLKYVRMFIFIFLPRLFQPDNACYMHITYPFLISQGIKGITTTFLVAQTQIKVRKESCAGHCIAGCDAGVVLLGVDVVVTTSTANENESEREDKLKLLSSVTQLFYVCTYACVSVCVCSTYFGSTMTSRAFKTQSAVSLHADAIEERVRQRRLVTN